jgi:hypothetical protein
MTVQRLAHQPCTVAFRSLEGSPLVDTPVVTSVTVYADGDYTEPITDLVTDGAGNFTFYGQPGVVELHGPSIAQSVEPVEFVAVESRDGGVTATGNGPQDVHESSPVSEQVSDLSLVGAPLDGQLENSGVAQATNPPPAEPDVVPEPETVPEPAAPEPSE